MGKITHSYKPKATDPIKQILAANGKGYNDLILNVNKNGKAIRISDKFGENRVHVTLATLNDFIADLKLLSARGVKTSVDDVEYCSDTATVRRAA